MPIVTIEGEIVLYQMTSRSGYRTFVSRPNRRSASWVR